MISENILRYILKTGNRLLSNNLSYIEVITNLAIVPYTQIAHTGCLILIMIGNTSNKTGFVKEFKVNLKWHKRGIILRCNLVKGLLS